MSVVTRGLLRCNVKGSHGPGLEVQTSNFYLTCTRSDLETLLHVTLNGKAHTERGRVVSRQIKKVNQSRYRPGVAQRVPGS